MDLLSPPSKDEQTLIGQVQPNNQIPPLPSDFARMDWGLAIGVCALVGMNLWQLLKSNISADSDLQKELIKAMLEQNKMLLANLIDRKT